jgi:hypothetical protein
MSEHNIMGDRAKVSGSVPTGTALQRKCGKCPRKEMKRKGALQRSAVNAGPNQVPPVVHEALNETGHPLESNTLSFMESRFRHDFSGVRVHTGAKATESAEAINAHAYTSGRDMVFNSGRYDPGSAPGRRLIAHELAHIVQQQEGLPHRFSKDSIVGPDDQSEHAAERLAGDVMSGTMTPGQGGIGPKSQAIPSSGVQSFGTPVIQRLVNENKVNCRTSGLPALGFTGDQAVAAIKAANEGAINMAQNAENSIFLAQLPFGQMLVNPNFATILHEELGLDIANPAHRAQMDTVARRFELIRTRILQSDYTGHTCLGAANVTLGAGTPAACAGSCCGPTTRACSCAGVSHIVLCRPFWNVIAVNSRPGRLVHESMHIYFSFIGDFTNKMADAHCYTAFAERVAGVAPIDSCAGR